MRKYCIRPLALLASVTLPFVAPPLSAQSSVTSPQAQWLPTVEMRIRNAVQNSPSDSSLEGLTGDQIFGGIGLGALGALGGWALGQGLTNSGEGAVIGAAILESALLPIGVHRGNQRRGDLYLAQLASYGVGIVGTVIVLADYKKTTLHLTSILAPVAQLVLSMAIERSTSREKR